MVGRLTLDQEAEVRALHPQPYSIDCPVLVPCTNARSFADLECGNVKRALLAGQNTVYDASRNLIKVFSSQLEALYLDWDQFHRAYDIFQETPVEEASEDEPALGL